MSDRPDDAWIDQLPPLVKAAALGNRRRVNDLLEAGASPNEADSQGWTALHASATRGHADVVRTLLNAGADVDRVANGASTALWNAAGPTPSALCVQLLLEAGADPHVRDRLCQFTPISRAVDYVNIAVVELLIGAGVDPDEKDADGFTLLMQAAESGSVPLARLLLANGADLHATCDGKSALDVARKFGNNEFVAVFGTEQP